MAGYSFTRDRHRYYHSVDGHVYQTYQADKNVEALLTTAEELAQVAPEVEDRTNSAQQLLNRDDLHLVCWEYVWS